jgi:hypothetical protein
VEQPSLITYQWIIFTCLSTCSTQVSPDNLFNLTQNELYIQSHTLAYGIYEFNLTVTTISVSSTMSSSSSIFVEITDSNIITNLVLFGKLTIKHNFEQALILNPGKYSTDPNQIIFDSNVSYIKNL